MADCSFRRRFVGCQEDIDQTWDFVETAAIIANCDLIITSDTVVAHLSAGMGHPTWLLLTKVPEWRWGMTGDTSFWYPSMRLFRQREQGNWAEVMDRVATALETFVSHSVKEAIVSNPNDSADHVKLGNALQGQGDLQGAIHAYRQALAINPQDSATYNKLGIALKGQGNLQAAIDAYRQALAIKPDFPQACYNLGIALQDQGDLQGAVDAYRQALAIKPHYPKAYNNLGNTLQDQDNLQAAIDAYRQALAIKPDYSEAYNNLGTALKGQGDLQAAIDTYRQALDVNPNFPYAHWNLSLIQLLLGDYERGWQGYEWRFRTTPPIGPHAHPQMEQWNGHNLAPGEKLIIVSEQGLGDTLQFMRYVLYLNKTGLPTLLCGQTKLHGLIQTSEITTKVYSPEQGNQLTTGKWFPLLSLPGYLQVRPDYPIIDTSYIKAPQQKVRHWQQKLATEQRPIIGINWQGSMKIARSKKAENRRSLPLKSFAPIVEKTTVSLLALQKGGGAEQLADCSFRHRFVGCQEDINQTWDFVEAAAMIANCDLIITCDTVVAHLAAGMGRPTWLLLTTVPDWRWGIAGDTSFWYPSMRLFRQREQGNWAEVMDRVATALQKTVAVSPSPAQSNNMNRLWREKEQQAEKQLQQGRLEKAEAIYRTLIEEGADSPTIFDNLAVIYWKQGRKQEATLLLRKAVAVNPNHLEAYKNLGIALKEQGDLPAAINTYRQALAIQPDFPEVHNNLGVALQKQGDLPGAINAYRQTLAIQPDFPEVHNNLGVALQKQGDLPAAISAYRQALAIKPGFPDALLNLGIALDKQGDLPAAIHAYRQALAIKPRFPSALFKLGVALDKQGDLSAAIHAYRQALTIKPDHADALFNLASTLLEQGDLQEAGATFRKAINHNKNKAEAHHALSLTLLLSGDYKNGWKEYEWRVDVARHKLFTNPQMEQWNGNNLAPGEDLMLISEQGLGDTLQFMRYAIHLKNIGLSISLCVHTKLHDLIRASGITTKIYPPEQASELTTGKWLSLCSLPGHLQVRPDRPIIDTPYIKVPEQRVGHWQQKLAREQRPIIGINWSGILRITLSGKRKDRRSLPLESFAPIAEKATVSLLSLQKGDGAEQLADCSFRHRFVSCQEEINQTWDFVETAAIIANCDLIITSDTVVAHLAAGMGHPTWLLLTKVPEWRWGMTGDTSFWYPSMRLFRQRERGNWAEVMDRVATALQKTVAVSPSPGQPDNMNRLWWEKEQQAEKQLQQDHLEKAEVIYRTLIKEGAVSSTIFDNLALIYWKQGRKQEATLLLRKAVAVNPDHLEAYYNLGIALQDQGDLQGAVDAYRQAIAIKPHRPKAYNSLGNILKDQGNLQAAVDAYRQALAIQPNFSEAHNNLGAVLQMQGDLPAATNAHRQALAIKPDYSEAYYNLGIALKEQGELPAAIDAYRQALAIKPDCSEVYNNLGIALQMQLDLPAAINAYRQALAINPNCAEAHGNLSHLQLLLGDYGNGWKEHEWRFRKTPSVEPHAYPQVERWNGSNLAPGERLIIVSEQGLGDTLQFMRYVLRLNNTGLPASLYAQTKLHGLIQTSGITTKVYSPEQGNQLTTGKWLPLLSLPGHLQVRPDHPVVDTPYIKAPEQQVGHWQQKLATEQRPIVGINWQGNQKAETIFLRGRSLPLESFAPIAEKTTVSLLSLQKGDGAEQLADCSFRHRFVGCQEEINQIWDFVETAAMIANCDLIITCDTVVAHLAAGMGRPTWLLLTKVAEWRWGMTGDTSFWYPSMRLFRQRESGDWAEVMDRVATALQKTVAVSPSPAQSNNMNRLWREKEQQAEKQLQQGHLEKAEVIYRTLIEEGADSPTIFDNLAVIYWKQGRKQEATLLLRKAVAVNPNHLGAYKNLGIVLEEQGDLPAAIKTYRQALAIQPDFPEVHNNLGVALQKQGDLPAAIKAYRQALAIQPDFPEVRNNLGVALQKQGDLPAAIKAYRQALAIKPGFPDALLNLGIALDKQGDLPAAIHTYHQVLAIKPRLPSALFNLAVALDKQGDLPAAVHAYRQTLTIKPDHADALFNLASTLLDQGDLQEAGATFRKAMNHNKNKAEAHLGLSLTLLLSGDYKNGWKEYEWRFDVVRYKLFTSPPVDRWTGNNLAPGEDLTLVSETGQGLGDTLQFIRYALYLKNTGLSISLCVHTKLHDLIRASGITTKIYPPEQASELTTGKWLPLCSLPGHLQVRPDHPIIDTPYIKVPEQRVDHWQQKLAREQHPIVGINWSGILRVTLSGKREDWRSLPLESFAPIAEKTTVSFLSLQKGDGAEQLADCSFRHRFVGCQEEINQTWDFVETAAIIANCDLIITSDTAVAHLSAGMGHPTWLLLTKVPEWRWGTTGDTSFWYPPHAAVPPAGTGRLGRGDGPCGHGAGGVRQTGNSCRLSIT